VYGLPSDPLGEVWRLAQFDRGEIELIGDDVSDQANAPSGVPLRRPADASQILYDGPASLIARSLGPVTAYNVLVFLALLTTGLSAYLCFRWLGIGRVGSAAGAALFELAPVHMVEVQLHVALALVFMLPVLLALGIRALQHPSPGRGAAFGAALGLAGYVTGYLFLEAVVVAVGIGAAAIVRAVFDAGVRRVLALSALAAAASSLAVLTPLLVVLLAYRGELAPELDRPIEDVAAFSLQAQSYIDLDSKSYVGVAGLALAVGGLIVGRSRSPLVYSAALVGLSGFAFSLRPELSVLGLEVSMPSKLVHSIIPYWRVFGRVEIVASLAVAMLTALLIDRLISMQAAVRMVAVGLALLAVVDVLERPPAPATDLGQADSTAEALSLGKGPIAEYPLFGFDNYQLGPYLLRQLRHGRPLLNGSISGTLAADLASAASTLQAPEAREALSIAGVRAAVVHPGSPIPEDARVLTRLPDGTSIFKVPRDPTAAIATVRGGYEPEKGPDGTPFQWLGARASLRTVAAPGQPVTVQLVALSPGVPRMVRLGSVTRTVSTAATPIKLCVEPGSKGSTTIRISTVPAPQPLSGADQRVAGIGIYRLHADLGCSSR
jgi:hypothetical protein